MATTLTAFSAPKRITLNATVGLVTQVIVPAHTRFLEVRFENAVGQVAISGTDGAALGSDYYTVSANMTRDIPISNGTIGQGTSTTTMSFYIACSSASGVVTVVAKR